MKIFIKKLGCPKNDVDADYIAGRLIDAGHQLVTDDTEAEAVIVNTCGFILPAKEESINEIVYYEKLKQAGKIKKLFVTGCLSQRYGNDLREEITEADGIFGLGRLDQIIAKVGDIDNKLPILNVEKANKLDFLAAPTRQFNREYPYEYIKIADGCDRFCSYCAIPLIRGRYRSRSIEDIIREAQMLADNGKKELILVSQEGTGYGRDFKSGTGPIDLLKQLEKIKNAEWIRLMYLHPESLTDDLIDYMTDSEKVLGYFDMPLQHISDRMLKLMNRKVTRSLIEKKLDRIRKKSSGNIIRTTFIAGHPGETDKDYEELHDFIEQFRFDRLGVFNYSAEEDTRAYNMDDMVDENLAIERQDLLMSLQQEIAFEKNIALIGTDQKVIIDEIRDDNLGVGRTEGDCPEIDQVVYLSGDRLRAGDILTVHITGAEGYDLIAHTEADHESDK